MKWIYLLLVIFLIGCSAEADTCGFEEVCGVAYDMEEFEIGPKELNGRISVNPNIKLIDVREDYEYSEGHIKDSVLLSLGEIDKESVKNLNLEKNDEIILICRSGSRSETAYEMFREMGYTNAKSLFGGVIIWQEEGYELV